jgi:deoxyribose-phosphate aldolase
MVHDAETPKPEQLASLIDHTLLRPDARLAEIEQYCREAVAFSFRSVCVNPVFVPHVSRLLQGNPVQTCTVIGFPLGAVPGMFKAYETEKSLAAGAQEIDMVLAIGALKDGDHVHVRNDIAAVRKASGNAILKVIIEACLLTDEEKVLACRLAADTGADFVKTSTGFSRGGATVEDVALMRVTVGPDMGVKASGGIRTYDDTMRMIRAGANRIGTSAGATIMEQAGMAI